MERGAALFGKATFAMDRGYDDNKMFLKLDELEQDYVSPSYCQKETLLPWKMDSCHTASQSEKG